MTMDHGLFPQLPCASKEGWALQAQTGRESTTQGATGDKHWKLSRNFLPIREKWDCFWMCLMKWSDIWTNETKDGNDVRPEGLNVQVLQHLSVPGVNGYDI